LRTELGDITTPLFESWNIGNLNSADYDYELRQEEALNAKGYYEDGFYMEFRDWRYYGYDTDEENDVVIDDRMFWIEGRYWVDRFNKRSSVEFQGQAREGSLAIAALGVNGMLDIALAFVVWFVFLNAESLISPKKIYWYAWLVVFIVFLVTQAGLFIIWPTTYFGTSLSLEFAYSFTELSKAGPFGLYEIALAFLVISMYAYPTETEYSALGILSSADDEKLLWTLVGVFIYVLNSFLSFWFSPQVKEYWLTIKQIEEEEAAAEEAALQQDSNLDDIGPIFFNRQMDSNSTVAPVYSL
jgi:hypothetical protein